MSSAHLNLTLAGLDDTLALAGQLAALAEPGQCLLLSGPVGAGKTALARAIISGLLATEDRSEDIPSPTFTLVQTYLTPGFEIWHADLYRLSSTDEVTELGLDDAFETAFCIIEWPERAGSVLPEGALQIHLSPTDGEETRTCRMMAKGQPGLDMLRALSQDRVNV